MSLESQLSELKEFAAKEKLVMAYGRSTRRVKIVLSAPVPAFTQKFRSGRQGEAGGRGVWGEFRPPSPASSVRLPAGRQGYFQTDTDFKNSPYLRNHF